MSDTVLIFGAGMSATSGAPLMAQFLDVARAVFRSGVDLDDRESFEHVFRAIGELGAVYEKGRLDTDNIESVFAAFEMAQQFGRLGSLRAEEIARLPHAMRSLIVQTLEHRISLGTEGTTVQSLTVAASEPYRALVEILRSATATNRARDVAILTFNYDLGIDFALYNKGFPIDYGLLPGSTGGFPLLKLHGSLNWIECGQCGIAPYDLRQFFQRHELKLSWLGMAKALRSDEFDHCNGKLIEPRTPLLVPPTWNKGEHHERIRPVWKRAARHLSEARQVAIIGYSLPDSDHFFRILWALGTVGPARIERLWVINPALRSDSALDERYRSLFGEVAVKRYRPMAGRFEDYLADFGADFFPSDEF